MLISLSIAQAQFQIYYLGMPFIVEQSHSGFFAVMDMDAESEIDDLEMEGRILHKFFKCREKHPTKGG
jgi:hypothetical protein